MESQKTGATAIVMTCLSCKAEYPQGLDKCPQCQNQLTPTVSDPLVGTSFEGRYEILSRLGVGGMSVVYRAKQKFVNRDVAIKILHPQLTADPLNFERFRQEAEAAALLKHPNIIQIIDFGVSPSGQAFLTMEFLNGSNIADIIEEKGAMDITRALSLFVQACDGLYHAHTHGVIHRDLKPSNLVVEQQDDGRDLVKIVDFGIAKLTPDAGRSSQQLTQTGEVFGSPLYMSPEQCQGKQLDARSDIYSLGCVMYETLTGMPPLLGANAYETMTKHVQEKPPSLRATAPNLDIPPAVEEVIMKVLMKDPMNRFQTMQDLRDELMRAAEAATISINCAVGPSASQASSTINKLQAISSKQTALAEEAEKKRQELEQSVSQALKDLEHQKHRNKRIFVVAGCIIGAMLVFGAWLATWEGNQNMMPSFKRWWLDRDLTKAQEAYDAGRWDEAAKNFRASADLCKPYPGNGYYMPALLGLRKALLHENASPKQLLAVSNEMADVTWDNVRRLYMDRKEDVVAITDLDNGQLPESILQATAEEISKKYVNAAKIAYKKGHMNLAISFLIEAKDLEKRTHGCTGGALEACADELANDMRKSQGTSPAADKHIHDIDNLIAQLKK